MLVKGATGLLPEFPTIHDCWSPLQRVSTGCPWENLYADDLVYIYQSFISYFWNVNCARATAFIFDTRTGVLVKVSTFLRQKMSRPEGDTKPPTFGFMPNAITYWARRARHLLSHVLNTGSGGIDIFEVKLTFEMLNVRGQQHSFSTHERVFLWKCRRFWDRKCLDLRGNIIIICSEWTHLSNNNVLWQVITVHCCGLCEVSECRWCRLMTGWNYWGVTWLKA